MKTDSWLIDTNIALYLLQGNENIIRLLDGHLLYLSFVSEIELLSFSNPSPAESSLITTLLQDVTLLHYTDELKPIIIQLRKNHRLKFADAVIAATVLLYQIPFLTADFVFERINSPLIFIYCPTQGEIRTFLIPIIVI